MGDTANPIEKVLAKFPDAKRNSSGWIARCPAHEDHNPSLSISVGNDGRVLIHCHAGCSITAIMNALGMTLSDLMPIQPHASQGQTKNVCRKRRIVATYPYFDESGTLMFEVVRYDPKDFKQRRPDGKGGHIWNLDGIRRVLYRLLDLIQADHDSFVFVVEGEKDANRLASEGLIATTSPQGAGNWKHVDDTRLHGRHIVIVPDNDTAGRAYAQEVAAALHGKAASIRIIALDDLAAQGDVSDWLDGDGDTEELVRLAEQAESWAPGSGDTAIEVSLQPEPDLVCMADVEAESIDWLWPGRVALGKLSLFIGDPGLGKSLLTIDIAARVSTGMDLPDSTQGLGKPGGVVLLTAEDDLADTVRPRLDAAGADVSRINAIRAVVRRDPDTGAKIITSFDLLSHLPVLEKAITQCEDCRLVIIDPISAYLAGIDSHRNAEVRGLLAPLSDLAARHGVAIVAVTHLRKGDGPAVYRALGSLAFTAAARTVWAVSKDENDADQQRRLFLPVKMNIAGDVLGLAYRIKTAGMLDAPTVVWDPDPVEISADDALSWTKPQTGESGALAEAIAWLRAQLSRGPVKAAEIKQRAKDDGIAPRTLDRAKQELGVIAAPDGFHGSWVWELPEQPPPPHIAPE